MIRTGLDVVEIRRVAEMKRLKRFLERYFTPGERAYFAGKKAPAQTIAGCFAAKEAFSKFLGTGVRGFSLRDIEVTWDALGKPRLRFRGQPVAADLSITHSETAAAAVVCGEALPLPRADSGDWAPYRALLPKRWPEMHKGDCGRVFILAGSVGMTGAAALCAQAALRCGSGLVTVGTPETAQPVLAAKLTEAMTLPLPAQDGCLAPAAREPALNQLAKSDVCALGPGLGKVPMLWALIEAALDTGKPLLLDADGLNALAEHIDMLERKHGDVVLTPHPGEMARLCGLPVPELEASRREVAVEYARRWQVTLLLKGKDTVVASPQGQVWINPTGNSGMASGGMGDVLSGVIASLMGQGLRGSDAAALGAFLHGLAGDLAAAQLGEFGMLASDVTAQLPRAIQWLQYA